MCNVAHVSEGVTHIEIKKTKIYLSTFFIILRVTYYSKSRSAMSSYLNVNLYQVKCIIFAECSYYTDYPNY